MLKCEYLKMNNVVLKQSPRLEKICSYTAKFILTIFVTFSYWEMQGQIQIDQEGMCLAFSMYFTKLALTIDEEVHCIVLLSS